MRTPRFLLITAGIVLSSIGAQAQVLLNGSFELPALESYTQVNGTAGTDWIVSGTASAVDLNSNDVNNDGNTTFGTQYLELFGPENSNPVAGVSQSVSGFVAGETYELTADVASLESSPGSLTLSLNGPIFLGATLSESFSAPAETTPYGTGNISFQAVTLTFVPFTSGVGTVSLQSTLAGDNIAVDNVTLTAVPTPEPGTGLELMLGLGALAGFYFVRRGTLCA